MIKYLWDFDKIGLIYEVVLLFFLYCVINVLEEVLAVV